MLAKIEFDHHQRQSHDINSILPFNAFNISNNNPDRSLVSLNADFLHSLLIMDVLLRMKDMSNNTNEELIDLCKNICKNNSIELQHIDDFTHTYTPSLSLWWYTSNTFLFKILNKAFRVDNTRLLYLFHSVISDLHVQVKQCQCISRIDVYRGQLMTTAELSHLRCLIGGYISIKSFFSTTLNRGLATFYLGPSAAYSSMDLKRVLFEIQADPQTKGIKPFGKIATYSAFPNEEEVLFTPQSIFQIIATHFDRESNIDIIRMVLCSEKHNHLKDVYEQNRKDYGGGRLKETNPMTLGNVLQRMGKYQDAEMFYRRQLSELSVDQQNNQLLSICFFNLGEVLREKGQYDESIMWYRKSLEIDMEIFPDGHANIGNTYNSIGILQEKKGDYESALDSYSIAVKVALQSFGWNNTRVALSLNNLGNAYQAVDDFIIALDCHRIALMIRQKNLPPVHHRLAASHNNIAVVYHRIGHFDLAYEYYKIALDMNEKTLPPDHVDIGIVLRNLALLNETKGNLTEALVDFEREANRRQRMSQCHHAESFDIHVDIERVQSKLH